MHLGRGVRRKTREVELRGEERPIEAYLAEPEASGGRPVVAAPDAMRRVLGFLDC